MRDDGDRAAALAQWLDPRLELAPAELATAVRGLLDEVGDGRVTTIPDALAAAALLGFDAVIDCGAADQASRSAALRLLAADASLTYAFEAAADLDEDVLAFADRFGAAGELGTRLRERNRSAPPATGGAS